PYREKSRGAYSDVDGIRRACHEETATLDDVLDAVKYALKYHGRFRMVHITERLADILEAMRAHDIEPKVLQLVHGRPDKKAKLFLVEGIRGGSKGLEVLPPLIVHNQDGSYSDAVNKLYGKL
ncbi:tRNA1(Val) (adenine(37)-N6)-methyltransferase, partial [uncultured Megasphaera sp.]